MKTPEDTRALSVEAFCRLYGIGRTHFYQEVKAGRIPVRKAGKRTLVLKEDAEAWLAALPKPPFGSANAD